MAWIDQMEGADETRLKNILQHRAAGRSRPVAGSNQRQGFWLQGAIQLTRAHQTSPEELISRATIKPKRRCFIMDSWPLARKAADSLAHSRQDGVYSTIGDAKGTKT
jgi:hypothetical protein